MQRSEQLACRRRDQLDLIVWVGRVRDVVGGTGRGLGGVVTGVERVDPPTRDDPVVLGLETSSR